MSVAAKLREVLLEARIQIVYLHEKFKETGSGNATLSKIDYALNQIPDDPDDEMRELIESIFKYPKMFAQGLEALELTVIFHMQRLYPERNMFEEYGKYARGIFSDMGCVVPWSYFQNRNKTYEELLEFLQTFYREVERNEESD